MFLMTRATLYKLHRDRLKELLDFAGGQSHLAKMLDITPPVVAGWVRRGRISIPGSRKVAAHPALQRKFPASYLRPDVRGAQ